MVTPPQTSVVFYRGMAPIRLFLRSHYGHVAFRYNDTLVEATAIGVCARQFGSLPVDRFARQLAVDLPDPLGAEEFAAGQVGKPYDWAALWQDLCARIYRYGRYEDSQEEFWDCSRLVQAILLHGGHATSVTHWPVTPQDLFLELTSDHPFGFPQKRLPDFTKEAMM